MNGFVALRIKPKGPTDTICIWEFPASFSDLLEGLTDSAHSCTHSCDFLQKRDTKQNWQREKGHGVRSGGNQEQVSKGPLPVGSHRMCFIPPAMSRDSTCEVLSTREARWRLRAQGFDWRPVTQAPPAWHIPKFRLPARKADVKHKPHCFWYTRFGHSELLFSVTGGRIPLTIHLPAARLRPAW